MTLVSLRIEFDRKAKVALRKHAAQGKAAQAKLEAVAAAGFDFETRRFAEGFDVVALKGRDAFRLRLGKFRALLSVEAPATLWVEDFGPRADIYD